MYSLGLSKNRDFDRKGKRKRRAKWSNKTLKVRAERPWGFWNGPPTVGNNMCPYSEKGTFNGLYHSRNPPYRAVEVEENLGRKHREKVTCPLCKRRLWGWVRISHDADFLGVVVPPHKRKKWWKK